MKKLIDKFYVLDFDRVLGDIDECFGLFQTVVGDLSDIDSQTLRSACDAVVQSGESFDAFEFLKRHDSDIDLNKIENTYIERAKSNPGCLLEAGVGRLTDYLRESDGPFCIMSYGYLRWQIMKIVASGLGDYPRLIVTDRCKSHYITKWLNAESGLFDIPKECFADNEPRSAREVILVDDKLAAFDSLPSGARGYLVFSEVTFDNSEAQKSKIPESVKQVTCLDEIVDFESNL